MILDKKQEKRLLDSYHSYFNNYLNGDIDNIIPLLADNYTQVGTAEAEVFSNKEDAIQFLRDTIDQVAGQVDMRNRKIRREEMGDFQVLHESSDLFVHTGEDWVFYAKFRATSFMQEIEGNWKITHQHTSFPDTRTDGGENLAIDKISEENASLREAINRRTVELDLKNRELEIEAALEKIRTRTMAMEHSDELSEVAQTLFQQINSIGIKTYSSGFTIWDTATTELVSWMCNADGSMNPPFRMPITDNPWHKQQYQSWKKGQEFIVKDLQGEEMQSYFSYLRSFPSLDKAFEKSIAAGHPMPERQVHHVANFSEGNLLFISLEPNPEAHTIFKRFAKVFEQTYTRFLDLKKAEKQAREAEIEAALERVRSKAMAMHNTSDLSDANSVVFNELNSLGIAPLRSGIGLIEAETRQGTMFATVRSDQGNNLLLIGKISLTGNEFLESIFDHWNKKQFYCLKLNGQELKEYYDLILASYGDLPKPKFSKNEVQYGYFLPFKHGDFYAWTQNPFSEDELKTIQRFVSVIDLTYNRYFDLQKAEAQAKEAEIQLALERVRARTMAMQRSDELKEVVAEVFEKLLELGFGLKNGAAIIHIFNNDSKDHIEWFADPSQVFPRGLEMPFFENPLRSDIFNAWQSGIKYYSKEYSREIKDDFFAFTFQHTDYKFIDNEIKEVIRKTEKYSYTIAFGKNTAIGIPDTTGRLFTTEEEEILTRFAQVFEQTYTRFLDLQKAEAQVEETKIQLAFERVRARAMAMHHSDELIDVSMELRNQMGELGQEQLEVCAIHLYEEDEDYFESWGAVKVPGNEDKLFTGSTKVPKKGIKIIEEMLQHYESGSKDYILLNEGEKGLEWLKYLEENVPEIYAQISQKLDNSSAEEVRAYWSISDFSGGALALVTYNEPDENSRDLLRRSANVFDLAYRRYKDLKRSERQARENRVELGLERVRSRAMAMHHSDELSDLVATLLEELTKLDFSLTFCIINIINEPDLSNTVWAANPTEGLPPESYYMKFEDYPLHDAMMKGWKEQMTRMVYVMEGKEKEIYDEYLYNETEFKRFSDEVKTANKALDRYVSYFTFSNFGGLQTVGDKPLSEENLDILVRFGKVFDLTYTRFNDLKQAEAQAREAQIEAALERVRSRSMAMHHTSELGNVVDVLFQEFSHLKLKFYQVWINIFNLEKGTSDCWFSPVEGVFSKPYTTVVPLEPFEETSIKSWRAGEEFSFLSWRGLEEVDAISKSLTEMTGHPSFQKIQQTKRMDRMEVVDCNHKYGVVAMAKNEEITTADLHILKRFSKVFEQTYTRFLDLKQSEAQARESQIQLSLERVRAKSMAMQSSEELHDVLQILFQQFDVLGIEPANVFLSLFDKEKRLLTYRASGKSGKRMNRQQVISIDSMEVWTNLFDKWKNDNSDSVEVLYYPKEVLPTLFDLLSETFLAMPEEERLKIEDFPEGGYTCHGYTPFGYIGYNHSRKPTEEEKSILSRFATEFGQVYQRFLDIEKAEAQAREAQIEAALERVRSRSMGMHKSEDLIEVVREIGKGIKELGIEIDYSQIFTDYTQDPRDGINSWVNIEGQNYLERFHIPYIDHFITDRFYKQLNEGVEFFGNQYTKSDKDDWFHLIFEHSDLKWAPQERKDLVYSAPGWTRCTVVLEESCLHFGRYNLNEFTGEEKEIFKRFGKVFGQAYTRFKDLERAEDQAREAEIETALERMRSRSLGMQKSSDIRGVVDTVYGELKNLGLVFNNVIIQLLLDNTKDLHLWITSEDGLYEDIIYWPYVDLPVFHDLYESRTSNKTITWSTKNEAETKKFFEEYFKLEAAPKKRKAATAKVKKIIMMGRYQHHTGILLMQYTNEGFSEKDKEIVRRFSRVFEQTYTRFLDLQKAEERARESKIEAALEKVRSRSMAMQKSNELQEVIQVVYDQMNKLGINVEHTGFILDYKDREDMHIWLADSNKIPSEAYIPYFDCPHWNSFNKTRREGGNFFTNIHDFEEKNKFYKKLFDILPDVPKEVKEPYFKCPGLAISTVLLDHVGLYMENFEGIPYSEEENTILKRFGKVFEQAYTRFLDLQKSEAQARESKIEAALEKVRSRTMAMQKSEELPEAANLLFNEIQKLGIPAWSCGYNILSEDKKLSTCIMSSEGELQSPFVLPLTEHESLMPWYNAIKEGKEFFVYGQEGEDLVEHYNYLTSLPELKSTIEQFGEAGLEFPKVQFNHLVRFSEGFLLFITYEEVPEAHDIFKRFGNVFDQTYRRFLDLKRAEAQAREAKVEASLERVRAKAMAMHTSEAIGGAISVLFHELANLGVKPMRCGLVIISEKQTMQTWTTSTDGVDQAVNISGEIDMTIHPLLQGVFKFWKSGESIFQYMLEGKDSDDYYNALSKIRDYRLPEGSIPEYKHYCSVFLFKEGGLFAYTRESVTPEEQNLYQRFAKVFTLTYRRYQDLKAAEQRAQEAVKQSSLDRVRGEIASMRTSEDLNQITPIIWRELQALEVPFFRCGVFIVNEEKEKVQVYLTTPKGESLGVLSLKMDANDITINILKAWRKNSIYKTHWDKKEFIDWTKSLMEIGQIDNAKTYQGSSVAPDSLNLHFVPFKQGMLYVGDVAPLSNDKIDLVKALAEAFSIAYARYEDFKKLEDAKNRIESTLDELKSAQKQLIQSEKMASLGELTAGIAHEIKNPLNFVNNFSEVSKELLAELEEELDGGDPEIVKEILGDVIQNLDKILHHGRRADSIVKGMLQHSRSNSGEKELTDINVLTEEYLNLAYHGLRAMDKSFNAKFVKDIDSGIPKVKIVSQEIGRVILNLVNNAFYAVNDRKKLLHSQGHKEYEPTVWVKTYRKKGAIAIEVTDNGGGIPEKIMDKIFQPFFTTKPTGQGTGLGLSLSYDIIKAHGGELKVETTKKGEGTTFIISLNTDPKE